MEMSTVLLLSSVLALGYTAAAPPRDLRPILPPDAATQMKWCAWRAAWYTANTRVGYHGDAARDRVAFNRHADNFKRMLAGTLSSSTCDHIKWMFWYAAWNTANTRAGYHSDAANDRRRVQQHYNAIISSGEMGTTLAYQIREMGWAAAWYCANTRASYHSDARRDLDRFNDYANRIRSTPISG